MADIGPGVNPGSGGSAAINLGGTVENGTSLGYGPFTRSGTDAVFSWEPVAVG